MLYTCTQKYRRNVPLFRNERPCHRLPSVLWHTLLFCNCYLNYAWREPQIGKIMWAGGTEPNKEKKKTIFLSRKKKEKLFSSHKVVEVLAPSQESDGAVGCRYRAQRSASLGVPVELGDDHRSHRHSLCVRKLRKKIEKKRNRKNEKRSSDRQTFDI